jgi:hypothetical protein
MSFHMIVIIMIPMAALMKAFMIDSHDSSFESSVDSSRNDCHKGSHDNFRNDSLHRSFECCHDLLTFMDFMIILK